MEIMLGFLALMAVIGLIVVTIGGSIGALFFGRRLPWIWFALATLELVTKVSAVALYREIDAVRAGVSLGIGFLAGLLALLLQRRFPGAVLLVGGFLAAGLTVIQVLGPLLNPFPQWLVISVLVAGGIAGAIWAFTNRRMATIVLSGMIGAGVLTDQFVSLLQVDEASRFQVYAVLAIAGIGFQLWRERRERKTAGPASPEAEGASA